MPLLYREPGFRHFEPPETTECANCANTVPDDTITPSTTGEPLCYTCATNWNN